MKSKYPYIYTWGNNAKRATLKGRRFKVLARGTFNSRLAQFEDGQREIISGNALKKPLSTVNEGHLMVKSDTIEV